MTGLFHCQPLRQCVLAGDDDVHVVPAAQAVVEHRQQAVCIRWQIAADDIGFFVDHMVEEARVLMREAVMILLPDM